MTAKVYAAAQKLANSSGNPVFVRRDGGIEAQQWRGWTKALFAQGRNIGAVVFPEAGE